MRPSVFKSVPVVNGTLHNRRGNASRCNRGTLAASASARKLDGIALFFDQSQRGFSDFPIEEFDHAKLACIFLDTDADEVFPVSLAWHREVGFDDADGRHSNPAGVAPEILTPVRGRRRDTLTRRPQTRDQRWIECKSRRLVAFTRQKLPCWVGAHTRTQNQDGLRNRNGLLFKRISY